MRVEVRPVPEGLNHRHHPGPKALLLHGRRRHELLHGLVGGQRERAEKLPVVQEVDPQHLRHREHPLGMTHLLHDLLLEESHQLRRPLGSTRGAPSSTLARECDQELFGAPPAANPCEAALPNATVEVARDDLVHETPPEAVAALEALLPRALDSVVERVQKGRTAASSWDRAAGRRDRRSPLPARSRGERRRQEGETDPPPTRAESRARACPPRSRGGRAPQRLPLRGGRRSDPRRASPRSPAPRSTSARRRRKEAPPPTSRSSSTATTSRGSTAGPRSWPGSSRPSKKWRTSTPQPATPGGRSRRASTATARASWASP